MLNLTCRKQEGQVGMATLQQQNYLVPSKIQLNTRMKQYCKLKPTDCRRQFLLQEFDLCEKVTELSACNCDLCKPNCTCDICKKKFLGSMQCIYMYAIIKHNTFDTSSVVASMIPDF